LLIKDLGAETVNVVFKALVAIKFSEPKGVPMKSVGEGGVRKDGRSEESSQRVAKDPRDQFPLTPKELWEERLSPSLALKQCIAELGILLEASRFGKIDPDFLDTVAWILRCAKDRLSYFEHDALAFRYSPPSEEDAGLTEDENEDLDDDADDGYGDDGYDDE
jgi:hypothetical protein